jgi:hypothetical protein
MPDSVANILTLDPSGAVGADFAGHVSAAGIDLDLPLDGAVVQDANRIQWKRVTDGVARGGLYFTQLFGNTDTLGSLYAQSPNGAHHAEVMPHAADSGGVNNRVDVQADTWQRTLIDAAGGSDYLRAEGFNVVDGLAGPWGSTPPPNGTSGVSFPVRSSRGLILCWCTSYNMTNAGMNVAVYMDGTNVGAMTMNLAAPSGVHTLLTPFIGVWGTVTPGSTGYVWFRQTLGQSDSGDRGGFVIIQ